METIDANLSSCGDGLSNAEMVSSENIDLKSIQESNTDNLLSSKRKHGQMLNNQQNPNMLAHSVCKILCQERMVSEGGDNCDSDISQHAEFSNSPYSVQPSESHFDIAKVVKMEDQSSEHAENLYEDYQTINQNDNDDAMTQTGEFPNQHYQVYVENQDTNSQEGLKNNATPTFQNQSIQVYVENQDSEIENNQHEHQNDYESREDLEETDNQAQDIQNIGNQTEEAAEIVKKLCKNGKLMQFQEGEDYIKVIVYEDSQENENADPEDTLSAEEIENTYEDNQKKQRSEKNAKSRNLMDCLTETAEKSSGHREVVGVSQNGNHQSQSNRFDGMFTSTPLTASPTSVLTPAAAIQSNFTHTVNQFAPSFLPCNMVDIEQQQQVLHMATESQHPVGSVSENNQRMFYTPHPKNGYMYYMPEGTETYPNTTRTPLSTASGYTPYTAANRMVTPGSQTVRLNSSGEENISPTDPMDTPTSRGDRIPKVRSLIALPHYDLDDNNKIREQHNQKERRRRARIKEACNLLRQLVPGMSDKTDKATVFEFAARYVHYLKSNTGTQYDKDFLMKYSPY